MSKDYDNSQDSKHVVDMLSSYIDNALSSSERESVCAHLESCDSCRIEHDGLIGMKAMLQNLPVVSPPRAFTLTPEMIGAGARRESFWQKLLTPRAVPRFATGSVIAFALLALLLVGDFMGSRSGTFSMSAPYAAEVPASGGAQLEDNSNTTSLKAAPTTASAERILGSAPSTDATVTTGSSGTGQTSADNGGVDASFSATPQLSNLVSESDPLPTVSVQDAFLEGQSERSEEFYSNDDKDRVPVLELTLATIGTLLAIIALVARRRGV